MGTAHRAQQTPHSRSFATINQIESGANLDASTSVWTGEQMLWYFGRRLPLGMCC